MPDIFLSYSRDDLPIAQRFATAFEREGLSVWWDQTLNPGEAYDHVTEEALKAASAVVVLWSKKSVESRWVRAEATLALRNRTLVPVMIEICDRPIMFELTHTADLSHWRGDSDDGAWQSYVAGVRRFMNKPAAAMPSPAGAQSTGSLPKPYRRIAIGFLAVALPLAGTLLWLALRTPSPVAAPAAAIAAAPSAGAREVTLAVLPFADLSPAHDQENFSDGLTEEILNELAQIKDLTVTGRTSSFSFKGKNEDLRVIGQKLGVGNLLEGSIRKDGKSLRITAQLINSSNGAHLWSQTYDRELSGIFALQEEIAKDVAQALSIKLDVGDMPRAKGGTTNVQAYEKFLRAESLADLRGSRDLAQAIQLFREAVAMDPAFARAWYGLYGALELTLIAPHPKLAAETRREMAQISQRVASLEPDAWWTQTMLAEQYRAEHRWAENEVAVTRAVATAPPAEISVTTAYVLFLWATGRVQEAAAHMQRVHPSNPLSRTDQTFLQLSLDLAGRPDEAQAAYEQAKELFRENDWAWYALLRLWSRGNASPAAVRSQFRLALQEDGRKDSADSVLKQYETVESARATMRRQLEESVQRNEPVPFNLPRFADHFGDKDLALAALRRALVDLRGLAQHQPWQPWETNLRSDPRFKQLLRDMGLAEYFRASGNWGDFCNPLGADDFECR